jgi:hypothetical protein
MARYATKAGAALRYVVSSLFVYLLPKPSSFLENKMTMLAAGGDTGSQENP